MARPKVFVSHSHMDDAFAEQLVKDLRAAGVDAWLDKEDLGAGDFQDRISEALGDCEWFVLVLTRNALASKWVIQEVNAANSLKHQERIRNLIFIQAGPVEYHELPALWSVYNVFDATVNYAAARNRVLRAVGIVLRKKPAPRETGELPYLPPSANGGPDVTLLHAPNAPRRSGSRQLPQWTPEPTSTLLPRLSAQMVLSDRIELEIHAGQFEKALESCEEYRQHFPHDRSIWFKRAVVLEKLGRYKEAEAARMNGAGFDVEPDF